MYSIKEIFYTLQGEGANAGRAAIFCRFTGCNLWSGREKDRDRAICKFCDTDFVGTDGTMGGRYKTARALVEAMQGLWPDNHKKNKFEIAEKLYNEVIKVDPEHLFDVLVKKDLSNNDALFVSCTALPVLSIIKTPPGPVAKIVPDECIFTWTLFFMIY